MIASTKKICNQIEDEMKKSEFRNNVVNILKRRNNQKDIKLNLSQKELNAIKSLAEDKSIHISKADKGNVTVIMDTNDYLKTVDKVIEKEKYKKLCSTNPINFYAKEINNVIKEITKIQQSPKAMTLGFFSNNSDNDLILSHRSLISFIRSNPLCAWLYTTPKIHKKDFTTKHQVRHITANHELTPGHEFLKKIVKVIPATGGKYKNIHQRWISFC